MTREEAIQLLDSMARAVMGISVLLNKGAVHESRAMLDGLAKRLALARRLANEANAERLDRTIE